MEGPLRSDDERLLPVLDSSNIDIIEVQPADQPVFPEKPSTARVGIKLLALGQILSLLLTGTGVFSQLLAERDISIPTSQSFINYVLLSLFIIPVLRRKGRLSVPWWHYALLGLCDVEGNFFVVMAYQYTTITSVQLLDCFTVVVVMLLSRLALGVRYTRQHVFACVLCILGLGMLVVSDVISHRYEEEEVPVADKILGDAFVLIGCVFYGLSNVGQEYMVKKYDRYEFLGMLGVFGTVFSGVQMLILERDGLKQLPWTDDAVLLCLAGFVACLFSVYLLVPELLTQASALFLNLSMLSSDFWSIIAAVLLFSARLHALYFFAFALIILGLILYNLAQAQTTLSDAVRSCLRRARAAHAHDTLLEEEVERSDAPAPAPASVSTVSTFGDGSIPGPAAAASIQHSTAA